MAATATGRRLTRMHGRAQSVVSAAAVRELRAAWALLDPRDLDGSSELWLSRSTDIVRKYRRRSAILTATYLSAFRQAEIGEPLDFQPSAGKPMNEQQVRTSLLVTGPVRVKAGVSRGLPMKTAVRFAEAASIFAAERHVLNGGRDLIADSFRDDNRIIGFARVVGSSNPCAFCAMLASRGPVYLDQHSAGDTSFDLFRYHDNCGCEAEPVYRTDSQWPPRSREFKSLWDSVKRDHGTFEGSEFQEFSRRLSGAAED